MRWIPERLEFMIDVVLLPANIDPFVLPRAQVAVLDVLRASSSVVTALANGAKQVRLFDTPEQVLKARQGFVGPVKTAGERSCVKIPGFDLGNSPAEFETHQIGGSTVLMSTTNGTRAAAAAMAAEQMFICGLLNAGATAQALLPRIDELDTLLVLAGTDGKPALEDLLGAGAVLWHILGGTLRPNLPFTDTAWMAYHAFSAVRSRLKPALRLGAGGVHLIENGFEDDIDLCAELDAKPIVALVEKGTLNVTSAS